MFRAALEWLGFAPSDDHSLSHHGQHDHADHHGHTHGVIDPTIASTSRGIWAIKWSFVLLAITAVFQLAVVFASGSVALLADTIHNVGDAATAVPLWIAFMFARRKPSARFTYGYGRVEDLAGVTIVLIILFSAVVAGYQAIDRLINPHPINQLLWVALAGVIGFIGNEVVAVFRIRVGREINSAALIADGYHARTDGLTSLAVVLGAAGVWLGFPLADPIVGLLITAIIFGIVWQSAKAVFTRMLDGIEPSIPAEIRHTAEHVPGIQQIGDVRARWIGHQLHAEVDVLASATLTVAEAEEVILRFERELTAHIPALARARIRVQPADAVPGIALKHSEHRQDVGHHHAPNPIHLQGNLAGGILEIIDTPNGERMKFTTSRHVADLKAEVTIERGFDKVEMLPLVPDPDNDAALISAMAPAEPHEFDAKLTLMIGSSSETLRFRMVEPVHTH